MGSKCSHFHITKKWLFILIPNGFNSHWLIIVWIISFRAANWLFLNAFNPSTSFSWHSSVKKIFLKQIIIRCKLLLLKSRGLLNSSLLTTFRIRSWWKNHRPGLFFSCFVFKCQLNALYLWKWKCYSLSHVLLFVTLWTVAYQAPLSMGFSRQEYWSG